MKQITLALHNYHDEFDCLPPAAVYGPDGRAWHSWRVLILPYLRLEQAPQGYRFDEPWDSPHNLAFATANAPRVLHCPSDVDSDGDRTSYLAIVGDSAGWPQGGQAGEFGKVTDGLSNTLLIVEVSDSGVLWTEPRDLRIDEMTFSVNATKGFGIRSRHGENARVGMADGAVRNLSVQTSPETVQSLATRNDGEVKGEW